MALATRNIIKVVALIGSIVSAMSLIAMFGFIPDSSGWTSRLTSNALIILLVSTPIAAALLVVVLRGWARVLAMCGLVPAMAAAVLVLVYWLAPAIDDEIFGLIGFVLVELLLPLFALLVIIAAVALVVQDVARWTAAKQITAGPS